jgi:uncharacterized membrane protein (UPF0127 family)
VFVFIIIGFIVSLSNFTKNKNLNLTFGQKIFNTSSATTEETWILRGDGLLLADDGHEIFIELAKTKEEREQGLSGKEKLKVYNHGEVLVTEGMLFVFENPDVLSFWMKDMNFDLDMIWLDEDYRIIKIAEDAKASSYDSQNQGSSQIFANDVDSKAKYLLEINSGIAKKMDLKVGDILRLQ